MKINIFGEKVNVSKKLIEKMIEAEVVKKIVRTLNSK